jgi:CBS domain-containing protein
MNAARTNVPGVVGDLMALEPAVIRATDPLAEAARLMDGRHVHGLPVVDGAGTLVGVISQTDLLRARATEYLWANFDDLRVKHLMTSPALTIRRDTPVALAARKMERHHVHRLVVVADDDERLPIGVLSSTDLVHTMAAPRTMPPPAAPEPVADTGPAPDAGTPIAGQV